MVGLFSVLFVLGEQLGWESAATWHALVARPEGQLGAAAILIGALVADLVLPVPSSIVMTLSGAALGLILGSLVNIAGSLGGAWLGWGLCRWLGRPVIARVLGGEQPAVEAWFGRWGPWAIVLSRAVPMLTEIVSCLAGLHGVSFARFTLLTLLGTVPISVVYAWAGSAGVTSLWIPLLVAFGIPALGYGVARMIQSQARSS